MAIGKALSSSFEMKFKTWLDCAVKNIFLNEKSFFWDCHPTIAETVCTCNIQSRTEEYGTKRLSLGDGLSIPAKHALSFVFNLFLLSVFAQHTRVEKLNKSDSAFLIVKHWDCGEVLY